MSYLILRFNGDECYSAQSAPKNYIKKENEEIIESTEELPLFLYNKEPLRSKIKLEKLEKKQEEIISSYSYLSGLSVGHKNDDEWKNWIESIITFLDQFEGKTINDDVIFFPEDPLGNKEVLNFKGL